MAGQIVAHDHADYHFVAGCDLGEDADDEPDHDAQPDIDSETCTCPERLPFRHRQGLSPVIGARIADGLPRLLYAALAALLMSLEGRLLALEGRVHATPRWAADKGCAGKG